MSYTKTVWTETVAITPGRLNNLETQYDKAKADSNAVQANLNTHTGETNAHGATLTATAGRIIIRDAAGRAQVAAPSVGSDIARKTEVDTVQTNLDAHKSNIANPHNVTASQVGAPVSVDGVSNAGGNVDLVAGTNISIAPDNAHKRITIGGTGTWPNADTVDGLHASAFTRARSGGQNIWVQSTAPTALAVGDIWIDTIG